MEFCGTVQRHETDRHRTAWVHLLYRCQRNKETEFTAQYSSYKAKQINYCHIFYKYPIE